MNLSIYAFRFRNRQVLDNIIVTFQFNWNERDQLWHVALGNSFNVSTVRNLRGAIAKDILAPHQSNPDVPQGVLSIVDTTGSDVEAERDEFGGRVVMRYTEVEEA